MNVVDSSGWLEYFADGPNAATFSSPLCDTASLIVPVVTIYEVYKVVLRERNENDALAAISLMQKGGVVDCTAELAIAAASLSLRFHLPMADSLILATAQAHGATIWTQDAHFRAIPGVKYIEGR
ncbi:MAG: type II toxin-antitoxin system VapC family toxin [Thermoguttaceae bacterium]